MFWEVNFMSYTHLNDKERFYIEQRLVEGESVSKIAATIRRHKSSIYREINRNTDKSFGFYSGLRANNLSNIRQSSTSRKAKFFDNASSDVAHLFMNQLELRSSPEQISFILKDELGVIVSHTTIYNHIRLDRFNGGKLYKHLRRRGIKYKSIVDKVTLAINNKQSIEQRAPIIQLKQESGHWEIDTVFGKEQKSFLLTMVDIATQYMIVRKIPNKEAETIYKELQQIVATTLLPFKSITSDNGKEFACHEKIAHELGIEWYFCHPYCSNERGLNENSNGLIRDFYPKKTDFRNHDNLEFLNKQNNLNNRPRKKLGFMTPTQKMVHMLQGAL
jgi:IS30 family transposase